MPHGQVTAFFLFDVGDTIDLERVRRDIDATIPARLATRHATPTYLQYQQPPVGVEGASIGEAEGHGFRIRFKVYDYGVLSVALTHPLPETWDELLDAAHRWQEDPRLSVEAERLCRQLSSRLGDAVGRPRDR